VKLCDTATQRKLLLSALRAHDGQSAIVYAPTIARVEETVDFLEDHGIAAIPYHGQMENERRQRNQERWISDEIRVLVGTIAFGLGINKPSVRAVIHLSLPKSIEQYYQEAGRAGRDGLPSDCALLWQKRDAGLLAHFTEAIRDAQERERSWQRYHIVRRFAEGKECRHRQICRHFGETPKFQACGACDVCATLPEWMRKPETPPAPRPRKAQPAAQTKPARAAIPPEPSMVPSPALRPPDAELLEFMRQWRREMAQRNGVPAFLIMHDSSLEDLCRKRPASLRELLHVSGFGERKAELYGREIFAAFERFGRGARAQTAEGPVSAADETIRLLKAGKSLDEIAQIRGRRRDTVSNMVADLVEKGRIDYDPAWVPAARAAAIEEACARHGTQWLKPLKEALPEEFTYDDIRLVVARLRRDAQREA
jgi:ATP-dependent DNA helicase RecQ